MTSQPSATGFLTAREKWEVLSTQWMSVQPPAAPSESDVANYLRLLGKQAAGDVLILGCTPSLRRALAATAKTLTCVDVSAGMLSRSTALVQEAHQEKLVTSDWSSMPFGARSFDGVVGDKVFDNVPPDEWDAWLAEVARATRPGGIFATRVSPRGRQELVPPPRASFEALVARWSRAIERTDVDLEEACSGFWEDALAASTTPCSPHLGDQQIARVLPRTQRECLAPFEAGTTERELINLVVMRYWASRSARWTAYSLEGVIGATTPHFTVTDMLLAHDYAESRRQPTIGLERRPD